MSYVDMDHAKWMQDHIDSRRSTPRGAKLLHARTPERLNDFQCRVVDILGIVGLGIYNAPINPDKIDWDYGFNGVSLIWQRDLATWDFNQLTLLVFLCHVGRIRCSIEGAAKNLRLSFWQRTDSGNSARRHPDLDEAVTEFKRWMQVDHRIMFQNQESPSNVGRSEEA